MNNLQERTLTPDAGRDSKAPPLPRAIRRGLGRLRAMGDRLTGGGLRALVRRTVRRLRETGDRLTGGGLRSLAKRVVTKGAGSVTSLPQVGDQALLVNCLYKAAFGRLADQSALTHWKSKLESGVRLEVVAEHLVQSAEFQTRHGSGKRIDINYLTVLYRDGIGGQPDLEGLELYLTQGKNGSTRAKVLAAVARSAEALERAFPSITDREARYRRWIAVNDTLGNADRAAIRAHITRLPFYPLISVIMPIAKASEASLRESLNSVLAQLFPNWELCVTVDDVVEPLLSRVLSESVAQRVGIKVTSLQNAESAAAANNAALSLATGEFVAFLKAGDILPEHALYEVAFALGEDGRRDVLYTDCDQVSPDGQRSNPWFKPDWDPDLLLAQDYISNLVVYRRTLVEKVGLLRQDFEGAEFHDLALRATSASRPDRIHHIPAILYHRRHEKEADHLEKALPTLRAIRAAHRAVHHNLDSRGNTEAILRPAPQDPTAIRVVWPLPEPLPLVSVIIPTRDRADLLAQCVDGVLHRTDYSNIELLIVDNESTEPSTLSLFDHLKWVDRRVRTLRHPGPFNYSALNNAGARAANGEVFLLLNNDIDVIEAGWLREMVSHALRPDVGVVGAKLIYPNQTIQHGGVALGPGGVPAHLYSFAHRNDPGYFGQLALTRTLSAVTGACVAIRRSVFFEIDGLDEINFPVAFNDVDLCLRIGARGYRVVWTPFAELFHLESASRGYDVVDPTKYQRFLRDLQQMQTIWGTKLQSEDPFHNPNLVLCGAQVEIPSLPRQQRPWRRLCEEVSF